MTLSEFLRRCMVLCIAVITGRVFVRWMNDYRARRAAERRIADTLSDIDHTFRQVEMSHKDLVDVLSRELRSLYRKFKRLTVADASVSASMISQRMQSILNTLVERGASLDVELRIVGRINSYLDRRFDLAGM